MLIGNSRGGVLQFYYLIAHKQLLGLKTPTSGPWMDSTKKEELLVEISSFQKVYISQVLETSKIVSRFYEKKTDLHLSLAK